jgi:hypothetical protein
MASYEKFGEAQRKKRKTVQKEKRREEKIRIKE